MSERRCKNASETLHDYIAFAFAVLISLQQCVEWTIENLICQPLQGRGKLMKLLKVESETERKVGQVR